MKCALAFLSLIALLLLAAGFLRVAASALAQSDDGYDLTWNTVDGGGETNSDSVGGPYILGGTIGQPDAGTLTGGGYTLSGGFWGGGRLAPASKVYLPLVVRQSS
jgi:hypothetical protein